MKSRWSRRLLLFITLLAAHAASAQRWPDAAPRAPGEGEGPYTRLVIEGVMVIDGSGAPPYGPTSIAVEGGRIASIGGGASSGATEPGIRRIDAHGMYVMPGMVDTHVRLMDTEREGMTPDYALKLLLAHGITTVTSMQDEDQLDWAVHLAKQSASNAIVAPRIQPWVDIAPRTADEARAVVRRVRARGAMGIGEGSMGSMVLAKAVLQEVNRLGMRASWHMNARQAHRLNALDAARIGLHGLAHWYALPEALFAGQPLQRYPADYNFSDVRSRFRQSGRLWKQVAPRGSALREAVLTELRSLDFTLEPTFSVYEANRDYMGVRNAEWNRKYLHPVLEREFTPSGEGRFAHFYDWSSTDEVAWKDNFRRWMEFVAEYKDRGGRVVAGSDSGYMWTLFGFGYVRNLEMLQEAGFTTLEVLRSATLQGAEHLKLDDRLGTIEVGKLADLVVIPANPLENLKVFYGTGFDSLRADGRIGRDGGVRYTVKDGVVYDAPALLESVARMVAEARDRQR